MLHRELQLIKTLADKISAKAACHQSGPDAMALRADLASAWLTAIEGESQQLSACVESVLKSYPVGVSGGTDAFSSFAISSTCVVAMALHQAGVDVSPATLIEHLGKQGSDVIKMVGVSDEMKQLLSPLVIHNRIHFQKMMPYIFSSS